LGSCCEGGMGRQRADVYRFEMIPGSVPEVVM
jgi:hypothetical protein